MTSSTPPAWPRGLLIHLPMNPFGLPQRCQGAAVHKFGRAKLILVGLGAHCGRHAHSGGAAPSGASLDLDDVAGETDQDWCEGRASFPEDRLSDGGSGGATRVVPDDFGTDWTAEIGNCDVRMRKSERNHMKTTATTEAVSSPLEENELWNTSRRRNTTCAGQNRGRTGKMICKLMKKAENHQNHPRRSWALNHMGNVSQHAIAKIAAQTNQSQIGRLGIIRRRDTTT